MPWWHCPCGAPAVPLGRRASCAGISANAAWGFCVLVTLVHAQRTFVMRRSTAPAKDACMLVSMPCVRLLAQRAQLVRVHRHRDSASVRQRQSRPNPSLYVQQKNRHWHAERRACMMQRVSVAQSRERVCCCRDQRHGGAAGAPCCEGRRPAPCCRLPHTSTRGQGAAGATHVHASSLLPRSHNNTHSYNCVAAPHLMLVRVNGRRLPPGALHARHAAQTSAPATLPWHSATDAAAEVNEGSI